LVVVELVFRREAEAERFEAEYARANPRNRLPNAETKIPNAETKISERRDKNRPQRPNLVEDKKGRARRVPTNLGGRCAALQFLGGSPDQSRR
jgi:hypothetical protein